MSEFLYIGAFLGASVLGYLSTQLVRRIAVRFSIVDRPTLPRKIHHTPIPLMGGMAIYVTFWVCIGLLVASGVFPSRYIAPQFLFGLFVAGAVVMCGGFFDDKYSLAPRYQFMFPVIAVIIVIGSGIGITHVSNPFGGELWQLDTWQWTYAYIGTHSLTFVLLADVFTALWLLGMMYTTKFLDGLDGLVSGMGVIGSFIIFALSLSFKTFQPDIALFALVLCGAILGFLFLNAYPARIFLGEGGSIWIGFMLGMLAILSGGKVATALLVIGIPVLDVAWVVIRRMFFEKKSPTAGDNKHLHFRLLSAGLTHRHSVYLLWGLSALFGALSLLFQTRGKVYLLVALLLVMFMLGVWSIRRSKKSASRLE